MIVGGNHVGSSAPTAIVKDPKDPTNVVSSVGANFVLDPEDDRKMLVGGSDQFKLGVKEYIGRYLPT